MKALPLFMALSGCLVVGITLGFLIGRAHPYHNYEHIGGTRLLLDTSTGRVCDLYINPNEFGADLVDSGQKDEKGFSITKKAYPPACSQMEK
jgi:hypothetical protein